MVLAVSICVIILAMAIPSISGMLKEQKLRETFDRFDEFIQTVHTKAVTGQQDVLTVWSDDGIAVETGTDAANNQQGGSAEAGSVPQHFALDGLLTVERPAAMMKDPPSEWMFWRSGACEPVFVNYKGAEGAWRAQYDPLTGQGRLIAEDTTP